MVPFGARKLTGMVLAVHSNEPEMAARPVLKLLDEEPVLEPHLIQLGRWVSHYYCAPLGEVLRSMAPLSGEVRTTKVYSLTDIGRDAARQLLLGASTDDPVLKVLAALE